MSTINKAQKVDSFVITTCAKEMKFNPSGVQADCG